MYLQIIYSVEKSPPLLILNFWKPPLIFCIDKHLSCSGLFNILPFIFMISSTWYQLLFPLKKNLFCHDFCDFSSSYCNLGSKEGTVLWVTCFPCVSLSLLMSRFMIVMPKEIQHYLSDPICCFPVNLPQEWCWLSFLFQ